MYMRFKVFKHHAEQAINLLAEKQHYQIPDRVMINILRDTTKYIAADKIVYYITIPTDNAKKYRVRTISDLNRDDRSVAHYSQMLLDPYIFYIQNSIDSPRLRYPESIIYWEPAIGWNTTHCYYEPKCVAENDPDDLDSADDTDE